MITALPPVNPKELRRRVKTAGAVGLRYVTDQMPGITRHKSANAFFYNYATGETVADDEVLKRIKALAIPPAWTDVWICPDPCGHLQATGRDARGRKQNRYHSKWREVRDETKFTRMLAFAKALPRIRRAVQRDLKEPERSRKNVLGTVMRLLEVSLIRVGNQEYARDNESFGLTTMRDKHVRVQGGKVTFNFRGKAGKWHEVDVQNKRLARLVKSCQDIPGQELFQYINERNERQTISSEDVNSYLKEISGEEFTAKDFRTWAGTVLAAAELSDQVCETNTQAKKNLGAAIKAVSERLGNTPAVCRKCYIHPHVISAFRDGLLADSLRQNATAATKSRLRPEETAVLILLEKRLRLERQAAKNPSSPFAATLKALSREKSSRKSERHPAVPELAA